MNGLLNEKTTILPCGNEGIWESDGCGGFRCWTCMALYGSVATPKQCLELGKKQQQKEKEAR